jgi:hypothetical protein
MSKTVTIGEKPLKSFAPYAGPEGRNMATIKVILWCVVILAGVGYWRYAHAAPILPHHAAGALAR